MTERRLLWAAVAAFAAGFSALSVLRHLAFETGRFDLGNMVQAVWSTAHGDPLEVTNLQGEQMVRLGAHFDPILVLFAPLWLVWPRPSMLLVVQAVAVAVGAVPLYRLARKHLDAARAALGFALAYLLYPATQWMTLSDFHPVALATPLLLFAFWYLDEDRLLPFALFALLAAATKEHVPLVVAGLGAWYALARRRRAAGAAIALAGVAATALAVGVVIPHFSVAGEPAFYDRYAHVGGSATGILRTAIAEPGTLLDAAFDGRGVTYLAMLLLPLVLLPLGAPLALLAAAPELALNLLSSTRTQTSIHHHYAAATIPVLFVAAVFAATRLPRRLPVGTALVAVGVASNYFLGPIPFGGAGTYRVTDHDRTAARALEVVPGAAVVSASNSLGAHLSARRRIHSFPRLDGAGWIAVDGTSPSYLDRFDAVAYARAVARVRADPEWELVFDERGVLVFRRR